MQEMEIVLIRSSRPGPHLVHTLHGDDQTIYRHAGWVRCACNNTLTQPVTRLGTVDMVTCKACKATVERSHARADPTSEGWSAYEPT